MGPLVSTLLLTATAVHLGFQLVVTAVVYPALLATGPSRWAADHAAHLRRITPVVGVVYGLLAVADAVVLLVGPRSPSALVSVAATVAVVVDTATLAAPTHGRLARQGWSTELARRLRRADAARLAGAVVAAVAAAIAAAIAA